MSQEEIALMSLDALNKYESEIQRVTSDYEFKADDNITFTYKRCDDFNKLKKRYIFFFLCRFDKSFSAKAQKEFFQKLDEIEHELRDKHKKIHKVLYAINIAIAKKTSGKPVWLGTIKKNLYNGTNQTAVNAEILKFIQHANDDLKDEPDKVVGPNFFEDNKNYIEQEIICLIRDCYETAHLWIPPQNSSLFKQGADVDMNNDAECTRENLRRHIAFKSLLDQPNDLLLQCNATVAWSVDAKRIRLFLWDSNEVFEIISKIIFESKDPFEGITIKELASLEKKLISNDYSTMVIQFLSSVKTVSSSKGMIANLSSDPMGPRVLTMTDTVIDSHYEDAAIKTLKIYFVPIPTCIIIPITTSLYHDWICLRRFELEKMNKYSFGLAGFDYKSCVARQLKMFDFMCRAINDNKIILVKKIGIKHFSLFLEIIGSTIYKHEVDTSDTDRLEFFSVDIDEDLFTQKTSAAAAPSQF
jgi:hypothetical protein